MPLQPIIRVTADEVLRRARRAWLPPAAPPRPRLTGCQLETLVQLRGIIADVGERASIALLSRRLGISRTATYGRLAQLHEKGYVWLAHRGATVPTDPVAPSGGLVDQGGSPSGARVNLAGEVML